MVIAQVEFIDPPKDAKIGERVRACARALAYLLLSTLPSPTSVHLIDDNTQIFVPEMNGAFPEPFTPNLVTK